MLVWLAVSVDLPDLIKYMLCVAPLVTSGHLAGTPGWNHRGSQPCQQLKLVLLFLVVGFCRKTGISSPVL